MNLLDHGKIAALQQVRCLRKDIQVAMQSSVHNFKLADFRIGSKKFTSLDGVNWVIIVSIDCC
jgi:hypothetical protein